MLGNIKSIYFTKVVFQLLKERVQLQLIRYNKKLQNLININLFNYRALSSRYIIFEKNNKGKEYNGFDDTLIYDGEYLNGKKNGKGIEYYFDGSIEFEGEYLNGQRRKGKEFNYFYRLVYEGEYLYRIRWNGKICYTSTNNIIEIKNNEQNIKEYNNAGELEFEGEYLNGKRNGKGKEYYPSGVVKFEGEYINGMKNGVGKEYYSNGKLKMECLYLYGKKWDAKIYDKNNKITGEIKDGKGFIQEFDDNKELIFEGNYLNGEINGMCKKYNLNKLSFEGEYIDGIRNGKAKEYFGNKMKFEGEYLHDKKWRGKEYVKGKVEYEGQYLNNKKFNGKGYDENGNIKYELINGNGKVEEYHFNDKKKFIGEYLDGKRHGHGKEYDIFENYLMFEGEFINGLRNGKGKEFNKEGKIIFEGEYLNGFRNGKGKEYKDGQIVFDGIYLKGERLNENKKKCCIY